MGFDGVVKNINKYCYVDYDAFIKKYLFSLFLVDFSRFVVNHICANEIDKKNEDLLDCINQFMGSEDFEEHNCLYELIDEELRRLYCNSCDSVVFFNDAPYFVINLCSALLIYRDALYFVDMGRDYFEKGLADSRKGYGAITGFNLIESDFRYFSDFFCNAAITGFELLESDFRYFSDFFCNAANWCISDSLSNLFNKFILKYGVSDYFPETMLNKILIDFLSGKLKLSLSARRKLLISILNSNLVLDEKLGEATVCFLNLLMQLADTVSAPLRMKKLILSRFSKSNNNFIKIACCNYMELWPINYSSDSSLEVRECYCVFNDFFSWWKNDCDKGLKKQIAEEASKISCDVLRTVADCTKEYVRFDFPFLRSDGLFEMDMSIYRKYFNYFECVSDTRFIVVFIRELVRLGEIRFISSDSSLARKYDTKYSLGDNPIRRILCKDE